MAIDTMSVRIPLRRISHMERFIALGLAGWVIEFLFTAIYNLVDVFDTTFVGTSYLVMHPIYGFGLSFMHWLSTLMRDNFGCNFVFRIIVFIMLSFVWEYICGWTLMVLTGSCPWDYTEFSDWHVHGFICLDYAPIWAGLGALNERINLFLDRIHLSHHHSDRKVK